MSKQADLFELREGVWVWRLTGIPVSVTDARLFGLEAPLPVAGEHSSARLAYPRLQRDHSRPMLMAFDHFSQRRPA